MNYARFYTMQTAYFLICLLGLLWIGSSVKNETASILFMVVWGMVWSAVMILARWKLRF